MTFELINRADSLPDGGDVLVESTTLVGIVKWMYSWLMINLNTNIRWVRVGQLQYFALMSRDTFQT